MSNELAIVAGGGPLSLPAHLQGVGLGTTQNLMAAIGDSRNRIGLKGNRFRQVINGQEVGVWEENYLDVIIVGVVPTVSRLYYAGKYKQGGDNAPPTCYSVDNIVPNDDVIQKQSPKCETCPQNIKGSRVTDDGHQTKACGYFRRMAVILPGDTTLYYVDIKAMGLFGDSYKQLNKFSMNDYAKYLNTHGVDASVLVTRLSFDTDHSVPKLLFQPLRFLDVDEAAAVRQIGEGNEVQEYLTINMKTVDISQEQAAPDTDVPEPDATQAAPAAAPAAAQARPQAAPATQAAPKPTPAQRPAQAAPQQAAKPAPKPVAKPGPGKLVQPAKAVEGVLVDNNVAQPTKQAPATQVAAQEISSDNELADLLADLDL